jgi:hypothetical protein
MSVPRANFKAVMSHVRLSGGSGINAAQNSIAVMDSFANVSSL